MMRDGDVLQDMQVIPRAWAMAVFSFNVSVVLFAFRWIR